MKLEVEHIIPYLGYKLNFLIHGIVCEIEGVDLHRKDTIIAERVNYKLEDVKPILRPLSDLTKEIEHISYTNKLEPNSKKVIPSEFFKKHWYISIRKDGHFSTDHGDGTCTGYSYKSTPYDIILLLLEWNFDIFGLIEKGLAIDINKVVTLLDDNNGWITIKSESDLPKENYGMYHVVSKEPFYCKEPKNQGLEEYWLDDESKTNHWIKNFSHWQPIDKKQPPLN